MLTALDIALSALYICTGAYFIHSANNEPKKKSVSFQSRCDTESGVMLIIMGILLALVRGGII